MVIIYILIVICDYLLLFEVTHGDSYFLKVKKVKYDDQSH